MWEGVCLHPRGYWTRLPGLLDMPRGKVSMMFGELSANDGGAGRMGARRVHISACKVERLRPYAR